MEGMMKLRFEDFEEGGTDSKLVDMVIEMSKDKELMVYSTETPDEPVFEVIIRDEMTEEDFTEAIQDACLEFMKFIVKPTKEEVIEGEMILLKTETTEEKIERIEKEVVNLLQSGDKKSVERFEKIQKGMSEVRKLMKLLK